MRFLKLLVRRLHNYSVFQADKITVNHEAAGRDYQPRNADQTPQVLSHYGLTHASYCLCVASIEPRKNIHLLIKAYAELPDELRTRFPLVLVGGKGWLSDSIFKLIETYQSKSWLKYLDFVE